jgi:WD40 repeat protein
MARLACVVALLALLAAARPARADDLPPSAIARLGDNRFRVGGEVNHLAISPDGKQFVTTRNTGCATLILTVWDATTGEPIRSHEINDVLFKGLTWGPRGGFAVVLRGESGEGKKPAKVTPGDFRIWEFSDPKAKAPPRLAAAQVGLSGFKGLEIGWPVDGAEYTDVQISADGSRLAAKYAGNAVHVFDLNPTDTAAKLKRVATLDLGAEGADELRISADGKSVVTFRTLTNFGEMTATTWEVATGKPAKPVRVRHATRLMVTPDVRSLVIFDEDGTEWGFDQYDLATGGKRRLIRWKYDADDDARPSDRGGFSFTPSGRELVVAVAGKDWKTFVIDLVNGKERGRLEGHVLVPADGEGILTAVSADGTRIATADASGLVRIWNAKSLRAINEAPGHRTPVESAQLSPDGKRLLTWASDKTVRLWDLATGKELRAFVGARGLAGERPLPYDRPAFTPDGTSIIYSTDKRLIARDLQTGLEVPLPGGLKELSPRFVVFAPDGKSLLTWVASDRDEKPCEVWTWPDGKKLASWSSSDPDFAPGFSPDGSVIFTHPTSPERRDANTGKELPPAWKEDQEREVYALLSLRPNPQWLVHNAEAGPRVIEAGTGKRVVAFRLTGPLEPEDALSPLGGQVAGAQFANCEQLFRNWDAGQFVFLPPRMGEAVLVSETASGKVRRELRGHRGAVRVLGFTPDGTKLLTAGGDHTVLVWDMRLQSVPLPEAVKKETSAAKLWDTLAAGNAKDAYLAMARLARDPDAALKMAAMRLKPATKVDPGAEATRIADARAVELLEAIGTDAARALLKELAGGHAGAFRTQEAKRALERNAR